MSSKLDERVLVVPSAELDRLGRFQGFSPDAERYLAALLVPELMQYRPRSEVEDDPGFKQIIPYVVFRCGDTASSVTPEENRRARPGCTGCDRLGVGGHVSEEDAQGRKSLDAYESAMRREIDEEVEVTSPGQRSAGSGLINDDSTPVGQVHLGVVHLFELEHPRVAPREEGLAEAEFLPLSTVCDAPPRIRNLVADLHRLISGDWLRLRAESRPDGLTALRRRAAARLALVEPVDQRREDLLRCVTAPDQVAMAVIGHVPVRLAEPHERLVGAAQAGKRQLGRWHVRHDVAVAGDQEGRGRDLAQPSPSNRSCGPPRACGRTRDTGRAGARPPARCPRACNRRTARS